MTDPHHQQFLDSMVIGFDQWHDGIGYDLEALARLRAEDRASVESLLIERLDEAGDWRDVEALHALGTPSALAAVREARHHPRAKVRNRAIGILLRDADPQLQDELEELVIRAVEQGHVDMAERLPTLRVKTALLEAAKTADRGTRVHAASLLLYLCGLAPDSLAWDHRTLYLRFGQRDPEILQAAWEELRRKTGL
jgi:hypothetical protein